MALRVGLAALLLLAARPSLAIDTLAIGLGSHNSWPSMKRSSTKVTVAQDSIWKWDVAPGANVCPGLLERGGQVTAIAMGQDGFEKRLNIAPQLLYAMLDGDGGTAFDPDDHEDVPRDAYLYVDLGDVFRVNRIRVHPRLDLDNRLRFPQVFSVETSDNTDYFDSRTRWESWPRFGALLALTSWEPNKEPVLDRRFESRDVRFLRLRVDPKRPWEIAELELYSDGTVPLGEYLSKPARAWSADSPAVWGKVSCDAGDITALPVSVQTRTGPDSNPMLYFRRTGVGDDIESVTFTRHASLNEEEKGPVLPNPEWSAWQSLANGAVSSPPSTFILFRLRFHDAGAKLRTLLFEYTWPPIALELGAEVDPVQVAPAEETDFALSLRVYMSSQWGTRALREGTQATGFRELQVLTSAGISAVDEVLVDDVPVRFSTVYARGEGFTVVLHKRVVEDGTFVQVRFRGAIYQEGTRFEVRARDRRVSARHRENVYQVAFEDDVDPVSAGGRLLVRLDPDQRQQGLIIQAAGPRVFTPNRDGVNDAWELGYALLKLSEPAPVRVDICDLSGRSLCRLYDGLESSGRHRHHWDGRTLEGLLVPPGLYVYRIHLEASDHVEKRVGVVGVVY